MENNNSLIPFLPEWQLIFTKSSCFEVLENSLKEFLFCKKGDFYEMKGRLLVAISNWEHFCNSDPESVKEKEKQQVKKDSLEKDKNLTNLYNDYLKQLKESK